jgi:hypothetical protein
MASSTTSTQHSTRNSYVDLEMQDLHEDEAQTSTTKAQKKSAIATIGSENLRSVTSLDLAIQQDSGQKIYEDYNKGGVALIFRNALEATLHPTQEQKRRLTFMILKSYEESLATQEFEKGEKVTFGPTTDIMDPTTWQDLELLCGAHQVSYFLASRLDRCVTEIGRCLLYHKITQPIDDIPELENQRELIRELVENSELFDLLNDAIKDLVVAENCMLSRWDPNDTFNRTIQESRLRPPLESKVKWIRDIAVFFNKSPKFNTLKANIKERIFQLFGLVCTTYALIELPNYMFTSSDLVPELGPGSMLSFLAPVSLIGIVSLLARQFLPSTASRITTSCLAEYNYLSAFYESIYNWRIGVIVEETIRTKLHHIALYFATIKKITTIMERFSKFADKLPEIKSFCKRWKVLKETSKDFADFIKNLDQPLFLDKKAPWFSHWGTIFSTYFQLLNLPKELLIEPMLAVGHLDLQLSIAKFFKEITSKHRAALCFPTYLKKDSSQPTIDAKDFWMPMIDAETVVPTSLQTGTDKDHPRNIIITGPNAGGKSTITRAIIQSILMAQTLGIAPATSLAFTPFSKIMSYLNITDDCAAGNSYFVACAKRVRALYEAVKSLPQNQYALTAIDELFNGTDPQEGAIASVRFIRFLGGMQNCTLVANTHFRAVTALEQESHDRFTNYKVTVEVLPENRGFRFPYVLSRGISDQIITLKMVAYEMQKAGCPIDFLLQDS